MAKRYDFTQKVEKALNELGVEASVSSLSSGLRITADNFEETITGVITRDRLEALASRIRIAQHG
jgi:hypothetical protein